MKKKIFAAFVAAIAVLALAASAALADGGGDNNNGNNGGSGDGLTITQVASQVNQTVQNANCVAVAESDTTIGVNCAASNDNNTVQQICQIAAEKIENSTFVCEIDTNVPVPGPQGDTGATGATGATGPQGPPGRDGISFLPIALSADELATSCGAGRDAGYKLVAYYSDGTVVTSADGSTFSMGVVCYGRDAVQNYNWPGEEKYMDCKQLSTYLTAKLGHQVIVVPAINPRGQAPLCVSQELATKWQQARLITQKVTVTKTITKVVKTKAPPAKPKSKSGTPAQPKQGYTH